LPSPYKVKTPQGEGLKTTPEDIKSFKKEKVLPLKAEIHHSCYSECKDFDL
jgi:hypothetical protein